ncbi:hypothetical protein [Sphingomonas koreensis]|uniref:hypothetical protein n=1 Tax=Sphingomonas koreensis TaxID=93064 RepID=UPI00234F11C3|nr:hypothetical protein [Sphingomonas koreensis]MDC7810170.1 hypothetical protein [Sphingomonas koreensis]
MQHRNWKGMCGTAGLALLAACNNDPASQQATDPARTVANDVVEDLSTTHNLGMEGAVPSGNAIEIPGGHPARQGPEPAPQPRSKPAPKPDDRTKPVEHPPGHDTNKM